MALDFPLDLPAVSSRDRSLLLSDGRRLGYAEFGSPAGKPVLYFHGHPGCRLEARFLAESAARLGIRLIGIDRPGLGLSTFQAGRRLRDWPGDVVQLADQLGLERFAVVGFSGGGPYALACADQLAQRLTACGLVAGLGPASAQTWFSMGMLGWLFPLARPFLRTETRARRSLAWGSRMWIEPDRRALAAAGIGELMAASLVEAFKPGARGAAYDGILLGQAWGFRPDDVAFSTLRLWHGTLDNEVPLAQGRAVAERLPHCQAVYYPTEAHISLIVNRAHDILTALQ